MTDQRNLKLELLIKLLNMTTSSTDGEALVAIRKANAHVRDSGWDWERLLRGKITVVADPFMSAPVVTATQRDESYRPSYQPPRPAPPRDPNFNPTPGFGRASGGASNTRPPSPPPQPPPQNSKGVRFNAYPGHCFCCGAVVGKAEGFIFMHYTKWEIVCKKCNTDPTIPIPPKRAKRTSKPSLDDVDKFF